ncbi:hypothetical protein S83_066127, partial [Arachis hypogaea]
SEKDFELRTVACLCWLSCLFASSGNSFLIHAGQEAIARIRVLEQLEGNHLSSAAILSQDGSVWFKHEEITTIMKYNYHCGFVSFPLIEITTLNFPAFQTCFCSP